MSSRKLIADNKKMSNECISSSIEISIDDDSLDEDSNSQTNHPKSVTKGDEYKPHRRRKQVKFKNQKSHRVIEKRRRDRMNRSLDILLDLVPHKKPDNERRIEKTEIIEMAIKYIRSLISSTGKSVEPINLDRRSSLKIDIYRSGFHNGIYEIFEYIEKHYNDDQFLPDLIRYIKAKEFKIKNLTAIPDKKGEICLSKISPCASCDTSMSEENQCATSDMQTSENHENLLQFSIDEQQNSIQKTKVPIFVLHPSGTHYIPMCIDSSIVSHAFNKKSNISQSSSINEQLQCHPVSIPVNFNPVSAISDTYELDIQNINVIGTRHQTSVRPN